MDPTLAEERMYEKGLCKWLASATALPRQGFSSDEAIIKKYLDEDNEDHYRLIVAKVYEYVSRESCGITHYIASVDVGATRYSVSIAADIQTSAQLNLKAEQALIGGGGAGIDATRTSFRKMEDNICIPGIVDYDEVKYGVGEGVVDYTARPIHTLIKQTKLRGIVKKVTALHLESTSKLQSR